MELAERKRKAERKKSDDVDRKIEREWREAGMKNPAKKIPHFKDVYEAERWAKANNKKTEFKCTISGWYGKVIMAPTRWGGWQATETGHRKNPIESAASLSEAWHGRPAKHADEYVEKVKFHGILTDLGRLRELEVRAGSKKVIPIAFDKRTRLASSENGKQLYVVGGDQSLDLDALGIPDDEADKDMVVIGPVCAVTYDAAKQHLDEEDKQMGPYRHVLGEEGGAEPLLVYDRLNDAVGFAGGTYHIDRDLDFGAHSAGIRN